MPRPDYLAAQKIQPCPPLVFYFWFFYSIEKFSTIYTTNLTFQIVFLTESIDLDDCYSVIKKKK